MKSFIYTKHISALVAGPLLLLLASCGSSQYVGYDHDGIYSSGSAPSYVGTQEAVETETNDNGSYYQQLFKTEVEQLDMAANNGIFTDVDSYSSGNYDQMQEEQAYASGYAPWGHEVEGIDINIYDNRSHYGYYGSYYQHWDPFHYNRITPPWYSPYYGYHSGYGYSGWRLSFGSSWGYPYHYGYRGIGHPYYYYGYNYGYGYSNYGYSGYRYDNRDVSYNNSRRSALSNYNRSARSNVNSQSNSRSSSYANSRSVRAGRNTDAVRSNQTTGRTYSTRSTRVEPTTTRSTRRSSTYTPIQRSNNSSSIRSNTSSTRNTQATQSRSRSSNTTQMQRSTPTRNSSSVRSAPATRSSGTSNSSSRSSRGRGN